MNPARPTIRCLREDLGIAKLPPARAALDEIDHPLVHKASAQFAGETARERIVSVDDNVLFKVKIQRWRGAVWPDNRRPWLVAAGRREDGSPDDFYAALAERARQARKTYNSSHTPALATDTYTDELLPGPLDDARLRLEEAERSVLRMESCVRTLVVQALLTGHEQREDLAGYALAILVRADEGHETYVGIRVIGQVTIADQAAILDAVPGCDRDSWYPDVMPHRDFESGEVIWSNLMDPQAAATLLAEASS
ncbi:hypothetical protein [Sphaerimonospora thailandensis]|uniref:Uncharacterized protein n=1 Tax=Sphaerimonospora thailandensis TaxID=795644 RepID=A0A8J3RFQ9_9ACTN|nr:hypothetical protein [Sphaerimonospora thailandensis]GIH73431.1 hypothetical protein Mth01_56840 [Sphaerimonospora thailandensis]